MIRLLSENLPRSDSFKFNQFLNYKLCTNIFRKFYLLIILLLKLKLGVYF